MFRAVMRLRHRLPLFNPEYRDELTYLLQAFLHYVEAGL